MKKVIAVLLVGCLLAVTPLVFTACQEEAEAPPAEGVPDFEMGDQWVWSYTMYGTTYTLTEEVIGEERVEGRDCYVIDMSFDPLLTFPQVEGESTIISMKYWSDKATGIYEVKREMSGEYNEETFTITMIADYSSWESLFPLEAGKEIEMEQTTTQYMGETQTGEPIVSVQKYEVNSQEDVTVNAGTFSCWKITIYDEEDSIVQILWWSDEVKSMVKSTDGDGTTIMELLSYSVS